MQFIDLMQLIDLMPFINWMLWTYSFTYTYTCDSYLFFRYLSGCRDINLYLYLRNWYADMDHYASQNYFAKRDATHTPYIIIKASTRY